MTAFRCRTWRSFGVVSLERRVERGIGTNNNVIREGHEGIDDDLMNEDAEKIEGCACRHIPCSRIFVRAKQKKTQNTSTMTAIRTVLAALRGSFSGQMG